MEASIYGDIFKQIFKNLQWCGISSGDPDRLRVRFYIFMVGISITVIQELCFFISKTSTEDFLILTALIPCFCIGLRSELKMASIAQKRRKIFKLSNNLEKLYTEIISDNAKRHLVCGEINLVKTLTKYYFVLNTILIFVYNFSPLFITLYVYITKEVVVLSFPFPIVVPFPADVFQNWLIAYLHSISSGKYYFEHFQ